MRRLYLLIVLLISVNGLFAQLATLKGRVVTTDGQPAAFVNISLKNNANKNAGNTVTNDAGNFVFKNLQPGTITVIVSHTGLITKESVIELGENETKELQV